MGMRQMMAGAACALAGFVLAGEAFALDARQDGGLQLAQDRPSQGEGERGRGREEREGRRNERREERGERREDRRDGREERRDAREGRREERRDDRGDARQEREREQRERAAERERREAEQGRRKAEQEKRRAEQERRQEKRDERRDVREERRDDRRENRQEVREDRQERREFRRELRDDQRRAHEQREQRRRDLSRSIEREREAARDERRSDRVEDRLRRQDERLRTLREARRERREAGGRIIIEEPGNRRIYRESGRDFIRSDEIERLRRRSRDFREDRRANGDRVTTIVRPNGVRIVTVKDEFGRPLRRIKFLPGGRQIVLFHNRRRKRDYAFRDALITLAPLALAIPRERYIVDADEATEEDVYEALIAPPVQRLDRGYTLDEVLTSVDLRERLRRVDLDTITFDFGSWEVGPAQSARLEIVASVMKDIIEGNPEALFLLEGHTDAVGSEIDNLTLSDRRAESVATVLTEEFDVPAENLVTQGYGEQFLKIETQEPDRENRRVTVRNIEPLLSSAEASADDEDYGEDYAEDGERER